METNEQGLTKEEKIMFCILGVILAIAVGVLIINTISKNDRNQNDNETPITENEGQNNNVKDETTTEEPDSDLIEDTNEEESNNDDSHPSNKPSTIKKPTPTVTRPQNPKPTKPIIIDWNFKDTMVTTAYENDTITIENNILLKNGQEAKASIVILKKEETKWVTVDISRNSFIVKGGLYKYVYSYKGQTKELLLTVKNIFTYESINLLELIPEYIDNDEITLEEFTKYQKTLSQSKLELIEEKESYLLTLNKQEEQSNIISLVVKTNVDLKDKELSSNTKGISITKENKIWYKELSEQEFIIWLDINNIDLTNKEININIAGIDYYFNIDVLITDVVVEENEVPDTGEQPDTENSEETEDTTEDSKNNEESEDDKAPETDLPTEDDEKEEPSPKDEVEPEDGTKPDNEDEKLDEMIDNELDPVDDEPELTDITSVPTIDTSQQMS